MNYEFSTSRRAILKAAGVSIALPALESIGAVKATTNSPMRLVCISSALGMNPESFFPKTFGKDFEPSPVLSPLNDLRQDLTVFSHMDHPAIFTKHGGMNSFLSGVDAKRAGSGGEEEIAEQTMIFELWGNIGLRKNDYKLWSDIGRDLSPDWAALVAELKDTDLALFDLSKDVAEKNDLRTELPEVYQSLKAELIDHFANINSEYPGAENAAGSGKEKPETKPVPPAPATKQRSPEQFFKTRDRNADDAVTLEEFIGDPKGRNLPALTKRFKKSDLNGDGKLTLEELQNTAR